jgi:hypothetical protein
LNIIMRNTKLPSLLAALVLTLAGLVTFAPVQAQTTGQNLLENPGFEDGHYFQDGIAQLVIPNGWRLVWSNQEKIFGGQWDTTRPETVVWNISGAPANEGFYWRDGAYTLKLWNTFAPLWTALTQDVEGLEVGRKYRLAVPVYVDVFEDYVGGQKVLPERKDTARVRLGAGPAGAAWRDENAIKYSGWWTAESITNFHQNYSTFVHDFVATQPTMTVYIEFASTYPHQNNGFFFDAPSLMALNETVAQPTTAPAAQPVNTAQPPSGQPAAPAQPAATVVPPTPRADGAVVHVVQPGDTMWVIAIQYAQLLGLSPEQALPVLQERNGNPAFLTVGEEVIVLPAGATTPATGEGTPPADATTDPAATVEGGATGEATAEGGAEEGAAAEATTEVTPEAGTVAGTICVAAFDDANNDGQRNEGEELVANAAISISQANRTVSTYITDGASEPYCFELNEADSYQLQLYPPADYAPTTEDNWAVSIANNESYTVAFGISQTVAAAEADSAAEQPETTAQATEEAAPETTAGGGLFSGNLSMIVLGAAGLLLVLAGVGVYLLRRG